MGLSEPFLFTSPLETLGSETARRVANTSVAYRRNERCENVVHVRWLSLADLGAKPSPCHPVVLPDTTSSACFFGTRDSEGPGSTCP